MRPPRSGNSWFARSTTRGASGIFPLNHGLTVCRSEDGTSAGCGAISARTWSATTASAASAVASPRGPSATKVALPPTIAATAIEAASAVQVGRGGAVALGRERRILLHAPLQRAGVGGVELAVHIGVDEQLFVVIHHCSSFLIMVISRCRARASRDITVPIGTPVTFAISR